MPRLRRLLSVALITLLLGVCVSAWLFYRSTRHLNATMPGDEWVRIYFETEGLASKSIDELTTQANLPKLRTLLLPDNDLDIRIWVGFGIQGVDGLILRRSSDQWSGIHFHGMAESPPFPNSKETLLQPKSGWATSWQRLVDAGILRLPDASELQCRTYIKDGTSYVVEINMNRGYRTYLYDNPTHATCNEAKQMIRIGEIIADEFGLENFRVKD